MVLARQGQRQLQVGLLAGAARVLLGLQAARLGRGPGPLLLLAGQLHAVQRGAGLVLLVLLLVAADAADGVHEGLGVLDGARRLLLLGGQRAGGGPGLVEVLVGVGAGPIGGPVVGLVGPVVGLPVAGGRVGVPLGGVVGTPGVGLLRGCFSPSIISCPVVVGPGRPGVATAGVVVGAGGGRGLGGLVVGPAGEWVVS